MLTRYLVFFNKNMRDKSNFSFSLLKTGCDHVSIEGPKKQKKKTLERVLAFLLLL
jgi:hypothetical protein